MYSRITLFIIIIFSHISAISQETNFLGLLTLQGTNTNMSYQIVCTMRNGQLSGYSITNKGTNTEVKTAVTGTLRSNKIFIKETKVISSRENVQNMCMLEIKGTLIRKSGKETFTGTFRGYLNNNKNTNCGSGTIAMSNINFKNTPPAAPKLIIQKPTQNPTTVTNADNKKPPIETNNINEPTHSNKPVNTPKNIIQLLNNAKATIDAPSGKVMLSIWDDNEIDGDIVSVYLDDKMILHNYKLTTQPHYLPIEVGKDAQIRIVSVSVGSMPPNTARIGASNTSGNKNFKLYLENNQSAYINIQYRK